MKPWFKSKFRYIAVTLIAFLLTAGITNAVGMFRYDAHNKKLIFDENLNIKSRAIAAFQVSRILSTADSDLSLNSRQDIRIRIGKDSKFSVNNGDAPNGKKILTIDKDGEVKIGSNILGEGGGAVNVLLTINKDGVAPKGNFTASSGVIGGANLQVSGANFIISNNPLGNIKLTSTNGSVVFSSNLTVTGPSGPVRLDLNENPTFSNLGPSATTGTPANTTTWNGLILKAISGTKVAEVGNENKDLVTIKASKIEILSPVIQLKAGDITINGVRTDPEVGLVPTGAFGGMYTQGPGVRTIGSDIPDYDTENYAACMDDPDHQTYTDSSVVDDPSGGASYCYISSVSPTCQAGNPYNEADDTVQDTFNTPGLYCGCSSDYLPKLLLRRGGKNWYWCYKL